MRALSVFALCTFLILTFVDAQDGKRDKYDVLKEDYCGDFNCYELLDVTPDVDFRGIKERYNNLSLALHPDKNPNQTQEDKDKYVRINKAYEILSSKRRDYDEYLRIKSSLDSPVESPILVLILLYLGIAYVVLYYQRQQQQQCKDAILQEPSVIRYYWEDKKIDLTGKKKAPKSPRGKGKKKNRGQSANGSQTLCEIKEGISKHDLNVVIEKCNLVVPGYKTEDPTYQQACIDVATSVLYAAGKALHWIRWQIKYKVLKQEYTEEDKEYLCRTYHKKSEIEWNTMPEKDRLKLLNKSGIWNRRERENEEKTKKSKKKRN